jgi:WG containing repeat
MFEKRIPYKRLLVIAATNLAILFLYMALPVESTDLVSPDLKLTQSPLPILRRGRMISVCPPQPGIAKESIEFDAWSGKVGVYPEQLFPVHAKKRNRWGYLNTQKNFQSDSSKFFSSNEISIPPQFATANLFQQGLARVSLEVENPRSFGYIDTKGKFVIQPQFEYANNFSEGLAAVKINQRWGYIDRSGTFVISTNYDDTEGFSEGLAAVKIDRHWGYIDKLGKIVIPPKFEEASYFDQGQATVLFYNPQRKNNKLYWAVINRKGQFIANIPNRLIPPSRQLPPPIPTVRSTPSPEQEEIMELKKWVPFAQHGKYGYKDLAGNIKIPPQFNDAWYFSENRAAVKINDKWGYISKTGELVIPAEFGVVGRFMNGHAIVKRGKEWGKINDFGDYKCDFIPS